MGDQNQPSAADSGGARLSAPEARQRAASDASAAFAPALQARLHLAARRLGLDHQAADDVVQQSYLALLRRASDVRDVEAWLMLVVRRRSIDWWRHEAIHGQGVCPTTLPDEPVAELSAEQRLAVRSVVGKLSTRLRLLVEARYLDGRSEAESAELAGFAPTSFKKSMTRALRAMRDELERGCRGSRGGRA